VGGGGRTCGWENETGRTGGRKNVGGREFSIHFSLPLIIKGRFKIEMKSTSVALIKQVVIISSHVLTGYRITHFIVKPRSNEDES
jgi:hypothetical protein